PGPARRPGAGSSRCSGCRCWSPTGTRRSRRWRGAGSSWATSTTRPSTTTRGTPSPTPRPPPGRPAGSRGTRCRWIRCGPARSSTCWSGPARGRPWRRGSRPGRGSRPACRGRSVTDVRVDGPAAARAGGRPPPGGDRSGSDSLFKNAYFLMLSTGVSAVLGLAFWLVAARYYSEDAVGQGSAAIAAMRLLASITATTMIGAVVRFVPRAGRETARLVWGVYGASSLVVALAAGVFLLTLDQWGASYEPLGTPLAGALFVAACVAWALLTLQDGVLTGLRKAE